MHNVEILPTRPLLGHLPSLVLKVGRFKHRAEITREAWFYDEMESLQGVVVPRCYGWFEAELTEGQTFGSWYAAGRGSSSSSSSGDSKTENLNPEWLFENSNHLSEMSRSRNFVSVLLSGWSGIYPT